MNNIRYQVNNQVMLSGNSGRRSIGLHRFTAYLNNNGILCLSCQNSPDFNLCFTGNQLGENISDALLCRINESILGRCGSSGGSNFVLFISDAGNRVRIDCIDDLSFWIEFYIYFL